MDRTTGKNHSPVTPQIQTLVCFSHLRWDFVYQRPQHLLTRCASKRQVLFVEEPVYEPVRQACWKLSHRDHGIVIATPVLPPDTPSADAVRLQRQLVDQLLRQHAAGEFVAWYYTPMALKFTDHLQPAVTVYDCMDELSAFQGAPPELALFEQQLFERADIVFTGGASLYEAKRRQHANVHLFPSSIDSRHFGQARAERIGEPADQQKIARPRIGFFGVLDERLDRLLLAETAALRPEWQFVMIGPVVKIREADLPRHDNIHYLGKKAYEQLPAYIAGWDLAMIPFARNPSTRFISPTKTPEYLAAGKPVVSTPIRDVVRTYGDADLIQVAENARDFAAAMDRALAQNSPAWLKQVDALLEQNSWDKTWSRMWTLIRRQQTDALVTLPGKRAAELGTSYELNAIGA
jgi:glycosyltransferase involved in cell wall biosynthesis